MLNTLISGGKPLFDPPLREWYGAPNVQENGVPQIPPANCKLHLYAAEQYRLTPGFLERTHPDIKYIVLKREDAVSMAVSAYILRYTKVATIMIKSAKKLEEFRRTQIPLDLELLTSIYLAALKKNTDHLDDWLLDRQYKSFTYEELVKNPQGAIKTILEYINYTTPLDREPMIRTARQYHPATDQLKAVLLEMIKLGKLPPPRQ
jgi:LPS sulfotransferase NodH